MTNLRRAVVACLVAVVACVGLQILPAAAQGGGAPARIDVSIKLQRAFVYNGDGALIKEIRVSSGRGGRTPLGHFAVTTRSPWTTATSNSRVSMKWMTRFKRGIGFHGIPRQGSTPLRTPLGVKPVSHGCIRMADADAQWIYQNVRRGTPVNVIPK